jgi:MbtH protein
MGEDEQLYVVVRNDEEQYSIWPADRAVPAGWQQRREPGTKEECLEFVRLNWTDMRPASLRKVMAS